MKDEPDLILGYSVTGPRILHWIYVRPDWRKIGIARDLFPADTEYVTHLTEAGLSRKPNNVKFNPFL